MRGVVEGTGEMSDFFEADLRLCEQLCDEPGRNESTKSLTDSALKSDHADKIHLGSWIELNCEINIAFSFSITASNGAKQR